MADVIETHYTTDPPTVIERAFTAQEKAQQAQDAADHAAYEQSLADAETARIKSVQDAQAELAAMGLTPNTIETISGYPYPYTGQA